MAKNKSFQVSLDAETVINPLKMTKKEFTLAKIAEGYADNSMKNIGGVVAMNGELCVRPPYQRSYVVANNQGWKSRLIHSVLNHRPIGVMYFGKVENRSDGFTYNNIDGQQRIMTLCEFINGDLSIDFIENGVHRTGTFHALPKRWQELIKNYKVEVYICEGSEQEQINWFNTINQPSSILTPQEVRNSGFSGKVWLESAKSYFSSPRANYFHEINHKASKYCMAKYANFSDGANGDGTRQECLERAIEWACYGTEFMDYEDPVTAYMLYHCEDENADELIDHYKKVVDWAWDTFLNVENPVPYVSFRSVDWGRLYYLYHENTYDTAYVSKRVRELLDNYGEMSRPAGAYEYVLRGEKEEDEILMGFRSFDKQMVEKRYIEQRGCDPINGKHYEMSELHAHHIIAVENGGKRDYDNLVLLSPENHRQYAHGGKVDYRMMAQIRDKWISEGIPYVQYETV